MCLEVYWVKHFTRRLFHQFVSRQQAALTPDIITQPSKDRAEIFTSNRCFYINTVLHGGHKLRGIHSAKGIGREIAKAAVTPIYNLNFIDYH